MSSAKKKNEKKNSGSSKESQAAVVALPPNLDKNIPEELKPYVAKVYVAACIAADFTVVKVVPAINTLTEKATELHEKLQPYHVDELLPSFCGLIMCFFGGTYMTLIAAVEAYSLLGWAPTREALGALAANARLAIDASKKDDAVDADGDGKSDVKELVDAGKLDVVMKRKALIVLKSVNPDEVTEAISALSAGFFAVVATLKVQYAKAVTLGAAIGNAITPPAQKYVQPILEMLLPDEYRKWGGPLMKYSCRLVAISLAWMLQRIISAIHSAIRGGLMFARGLLAFLAKTQLVKIEQESTYLDEVVGFAVAFLGFSFQFGAGFSVPFPLNILLFPVTFMEYLLMWIVNSSSS